MPNAIFHLWRDLLAQKVGVHIESSRAYLVEQRLYSLMRAKSCTGLAELYEQVIAQGDGELMDTVIDLLTTHETSFFREPLAFELVAKLASEAELERGKPFRIWSAGCSSGEEPYSIALALLNHPSKLVLANTSIHASDVSPGTLRLAERGLYRVPNQKLSEVLLARYFEPVLGEWRVGEELKKLVSFFRFNLMELDQAKTRYHVIFCRNVLIYFKQESRQWVLERLKERLEEGGYLLVGSGESIPELKKHYKICNYNGLNYYKKH